MDDFARFSILLTAFVARGAIHSAEQTSAGSGVDAQALSNATAGIIAIMRSLKFISKSLGALKDHGKSAT